MKNTNLTQDDAMQNFIQTERSGSQRQIILLMPFFHRNKDRVLCLKSANFERN